MMLLDAAARSRHGRGRGARAARRRRGRGAGARARRRRQRAPPVAPAAWRAASRRRRRCRRVSRIPMPAVRARGVRGAGAHRQPDRGAARCSACSATRTRASSQAAVGAIQSLGCDRHRDGWRWPRRARPMPPMRRAALRILSYFGYRARRCHLRRGHRRRRRARARHRRARAAVRRRSARDGALHRRPRAAARSGCAAPPCARSVRRAAAMPRVTSALLRGIGDDDAWVRYYAMSVARAPRRRGGGERHRRARRRRGRPGARRRHRGAVAPARARSRSRRCARRPRAGDADLRRAALVGLGLSRRAEAEPTLLAAARRPRPGHAPRRRLGHRRLRRLRGARRARARGRRSRRERAYGGDRLSGPARQPRGDRGAHSALVEQRRARARLARRSPSSRPSTCPASSRR